MCVLWKPRTHLRGVEVSLPLGEVGAVQRCGHGAVFIERVIGSIHSVQVALRVLQSALGGQGLFVTRGGPGPSKGLAAPGSRRSYLETIEYTDSVTGLQNIVPTFPPRSCTLTVRGAVEGVLALPDLQGAPPPLGHHYKSLVRSWTACLSSWGPASRPEQLGRPRNQLLHRFIRGRNHL